MSRDNLALLKAEKNNPPIFLAPGIGDTSTNLLELANRLQVAHPVYGIEPRGINGVDEPLDRIEAMAEFYAGSFRRLQPHGPYYLIGYSLGGLVMLEVARLLTKAGETIALLVMVDSYPDRHKLSIPQHAWVALRLARKRAASLLRTRGQPQPPGEKRSVRLPLDEGMNRFNAYVKDRQHQAWRSYQPSFYDGKIRFVRAATPTFFPNNPSAVWRRFAKEFKVETVPGTHLEMLTSQLDTLAALLTQYVREALAEDQT